MSVRSLAYISVLAFITVSLALYTISGAHAKAETSLTIFDNNFTIPTDASRGLIAKLTSNGNAVAGENITWTVTVGKIGPRIYHTDDNGEVYVIYTAPSYENTVYVTASYAGSEQYFPSSTIAFGTITTQTPVTPTGPSSPPSGISSSNIVIIAIAIICVIIVSAIISGKM